jgi:phosphate transport system substrate-binding protein
MRQHRHRLIIYLATCWLVVALAACAGSQAQPAGPLTLHIAGSSSMQAALTELADAYQASHPNVVVDVRQGGSTAGLNDLLAGKADLAAVSWRTTGTTGGTGAPNGMQAIPVGRDAIALIVNPANPVHGLTLVQVKSLYEGQTLDWQGLGGTTAEPLLISREDGAGTRAAFEALVMGGERVTLNALVMPNSRAVADYVANHPAAIGYASMAELDDRVRALDVEGNAPTAANVRQGVYHLTRTLYLYAPSPAPAATRAFLDFVLSPAGQAIIAHHHVPVR